MASQEEMRLAAKLVMHEILTRDQAEKFLRIRDEAERAGRIADLGQMLLDKGLIDKAELHSMTGVSLVETQPIPDYKFLKRIAEGGMAVVYLATYLPIKEDVALKIMKPELARQEKFRLRFLREAKLMMKLDDANIVKGYEIRKDAGYIFCAMEHVDGSTVEELIEKNGPFPEKKALYVVREVAKALGYLNGRGVVHRDIKPGNILITESAKVKIIDLGLAKLRAGMVKDSAEGVTVGTVEYLSPEQARGRADVDIRSDIYSLGVSLFHMIVGEVPFKSKDSMEVIAAQVLKALESPELKARHVSAHTHYLIQRMMAKDRRDRFDTPEDLIAEIEDKAGDITLTPVAKKADPLKGLTRTRRPGEKPPRRKPGRRRPGGGSVRGRRRR